MTKKEMISDQQSFLGGLKPSLFLIPFCQEGPAVFSSAGSL